MHSQKGNIQITWSLAFTELLAFEAKHNKFQLNCSLLPRLTVQAFHAAFENRHVERIYLKRVSNGQDFFYFFFFQINFNYCLMVSTE